MAGLVSILVLAAVVVGIAVVVKRLTDRRQGRESDGGDLIAYGLLALAVGTAGFSLASLARLAFPGDAVVFDRPSQVATALAGLVVAAPIGYFIWRRQAKRRSEHVDSGGWPVYLALMEAAFMGALAVSAFQVLIWLFGDGDAATWTDVIVYGALIAFHQYASSASPPRTEAADLPRVVGAAIGLGALAAGAGGILFYGLEEIYSTFHAQAGGNELAGPISLVLVGAPIWYVRWWRPWRTEVAWPREVWMFFVSVVGLVAALFAATLSVVLSVDYLIDSTPNAGSHFEFLPGTLSVVIVGLLVWLVHRRQLGSERTAAVDAYTYAMAAIGLTTAVGMATWLTSLAFGEFDVVDQQSSAVVGAAIATLVSIATWLGFWWRANRDDRQALVSSWPRRLYLLGLGVVMGLTAAGALIAVLVVLFQLAFGAESSDTIVVSASLFIYSGAATWHLIREYAADRELVVAEDVITPYSVTLVCSHPGVISNEFPKEARLRVIYRSDDVAAIDEEMASQIVAAVGHQDSIVWVDEDGFKVAAAR